MDYFVSVYWVVFLLMEVFMVSCGVEASLRNKKYIIVDLQQRNLPISKKTVFCACVSLIYKVVWHVISSKLLL
jgi:hypothetical protein